MQVRYRIAFYCLLPTIWRAGDPGKEMYFIERGKLAILDESEKNIIRILGAGLYIGEVIFII